MLNYSRKVEPSTKKTKKKAASQKEWEVEEIIDKRRFDNGVIRYHVLWKGWPRESGTWERKANLTNCAAKLKEFEKKLSSKEGKRSRGKPRKEEVVVKARGGKTLPRRAFFKMGEVF